MFRVRLSEDKKEHIFDSLSLCIQFLRTLHRSGIKKYELDVIGSSNTVVEEFTDWVARMERDDGSMPKVYKNSSCSTPHLTILTSALFGVAGSVIGGAVGLGATLAIGPIFPPTILFGTIGGAMIGFILSSSVGISLGLVLSSLWDADVQTLTVSISDDGECFKENNVALRG